MLGALGVWHWVIIIAVVAVLFGRGKISALMGDVAQGVKTLRHGLRDDTAVAVEDKHGSVSG